MCTNSVQQISLKMALVFCKINNIGVFMPTWLGHREGNAIHNTIQCEVRI